MLHTGAFSIHTHRPTASTVVVAERLGLKVSTVRRYVREHLLESVRIGRANRVFVDSVDRLERVSTRAVRLRLRFQTEARQRDGVDLEGDAKLTAIRAAELAELAKQRLSTAQSNDLAALDVEESRRDNFQRDADQKLETLSDMERMRFQGSIGPNLVHKPIAAMSDLELIRLASILQRTLNGVKCDRQSTPPTPQTLGPHQRQPILLA